MENQVHMNSDDFLKFSFKQLNEIPASKLVLCFDEENGIGIAYFFW